MKLEIYTIYDSKAEQYGRPFYQQNHAEAIRSVTDLVNDPNTTVGRHPEDFTLFHIGEFDGDNGGLLPRAKYEAVARCHELAAKQDLPEMMHPIGKEA